MPSFTQSDAIRWNIFARELEVVLQAHGLCLGKLDDRGVVLQREKVRRLQHSLKRPGHFPALNPEEMDRLFAIVQLTTEEQIRLRAALLATAIERILMDRIDPYVALMSANGAFDIIREAMQSSTDFDGVRAGAVTDADDDEQEGDEAFMMALEQIDHATLALHNALQATSAPARLASAQEAQSAFTSALERLEHAQRPSQSSDAWLSWQREALQGRHQAEAITHTKQHDA